MRYILGSVNPLKVAALQEAVKRCDPGAHVHTARASSGIAAQPVGREETLRGARNRANAAARFLGMGFAIGIESGIRQTEHVWMDWAVIVCLTSDGSERIAETAAIELPLMDVIDAQARGFDKTTVGAVLHERCGAPKDDPHVYLTNGVTSRRDLIRDALIQLLSTPEVRP